MFAGIDPNRSDSVAEHIFKVNCAALFLSQLAQSNGFEIRMEKLLKASITHDWNESILLDIPSGSPSFQSYFKGTNIRETVKKAEETALTTMEDYLKEEIDITLAHHDLNTDEKSILQMAPRTYVSMMELRFRLNQTILTL
jgi:5'-deoxynucleotidase YfbR-like HD superfamily hydrolase